MGDGSTRDQGGAGRGAARTSGFYGLLLAAGLLGAAFFVGSAGGQVSPPTVVDEPGPTCGPAPVPGCEAWRAPAKGSISPAVDVGPDGETVVAIGHDVIRDFAEDEEDFWVTGYEATTGAILWNSSYETAQEIEEVQDVVVGPNGDQVYVVGGTADDARISPRHMMTAAFDLASGELLWGDVVTGRGGGARDVVVADAGQTVYVTGHLDGMTTIAYDTETGDKRWSATNSSYEIPSTSFYPPIPTMDLAPDGEQLYVTSMFGRHCNCDWKTIAYDTDTGQVEWEAGHEVRGGRLDGADRPAAVEATPDGESVIVAGTHYRQPMIIKLDADDGTEHWQADNWDGHTLARDMVVGPDSRRAYVVGSGFATVAFNITGDEWDIRDEYRVKHGGTAYDVGISSDGGRVYVTGESPGQGVETPASSYWEIADPQTDAATVAYEAADGQEAWVARANDNPQRSGLVDSSDAGTDSALGPEGLQIYVTGRSSTFTPVRAIHTDPVRATTGIPLPASP